MNAMTRGGRAALLLAVALGGCADGGGTRSLLDPTDAVVVGSGDAHAGRTDADLRGPLDLGPEDPGGAPDGAGAGDAGPVTDAAPAPDAGDPDPPRPDAGPPCPSGARCNPIPIDAFPFEDQRDTRQAPEADVDRWAPCAPDTDEGGGEIYYRVEVPSDGVLTVAVDDVPGDAVDVDVHLLDALDEFACVARDNRALQWPVGAGTWFVVVDTWVDAAGVARPGPFRLSADFRPLGDNACAMRPVDLRMFWRACAAGIDCYSDGGEFFLRTPATGPVVKEAHLVTVADDFGGGWPSSFHDGIAAHYALSQAATGYAMDRGEPWAPAGEGGSEYGQGAIGRPLPVDDEAWYVNMYWRDRPAPGTRMIVFNPENGRAVVAAAGYETGPGANTAIGGVTEEIHDWLETGHRDVLILGFPEDDALPLGPLECGR